MIEKRSKMMEYRLDLRTLLLMLGQSTGSLEADLPHMEGIRGRARAHVRLENGRIVVCTIVAANRKVRYMDKIALKLVQDLVLAWRYNEEPTASTPALRKALMLRPPVPVSPIPRRTSSGIVGNFSAWPRLYRHVYSLINGVSSVDQIVRTLAHGQDPSQVLWVLALLRQAGLITFEDV